jgi:hypothetical protein
MQLVLDRMVWGTEVLVSLCITRIQPKFQGFSWICMRSFRHVLLFTGKRIPFLAPQIQPLAFTALLPTIRRVVAGNGAVLKTPRQASRTLMPPKNNFLQEEVF